MIYKNIFRHPFVNNFRRRRIVCVTTVNYKGIRRNLKPQFVSTQVQVRSVKDRHTRVRSIDGRDPETKGDMILRLRGLKGLHRHSYFTPPCVVPTVILVGEYRQDRCSVRPRRPLSRSSPMAVPRRTAGRPTSFARRRTPDSRTPDGEEDGPRRIQRRPKRKKGDLEREIDTLVCFLYS